MAQPKEPEHPGRAHLVNLLDAFVVNGPNGDHQCLVLELMGLSLHHVWREGEYGEIGDLPLILKDSSEESHDYVFPYPIAKDISKQLLLGLAYLHGQGICHGGQSHPHLAHSTTMCGGSRLNYEIMCSSQKDSWADLNYFWCISILCFKGHDWAGRYLKL